MLIALWWTVDAKLIVMICSRVSEGVSDLDHEDEAAVSTVLYCTVLYCTALYCTGVSDLDHEDEATVSVLQPGTQSLQAAPVPEQRRNEKYKLYT